MTDYEKISALIKKIKKSYSTLSNMEDAVVGVEIVEDTPEHMAENFDILKFDCQQYLFDKNTGHLVCVLDIDDDED